MRDLKITISGNGNSIEATGRDAENMVFFSNLGQEIFNTLLVMSLLGQKSFSEHVKLRTSESFSDMFLRAVVNDSDDDIITLMDKHYGGADGVANLSATLAQAIIPPAPAQEKGSSTC